MLILWPDLASAIVGVVESNGHPVRVVYDHAKIIQIFMERDGMTAEDAEEFYQFNVHGAYHGTQTPVVLYTKEPGETLEEMLQKWKDDEDYA